MDNENGDTGSTWVPPGRHNGGHVPAPDRWRAGAACKGQTELFFGKGASSRALDVCALCPVIWHCRQYALQFNDKDLHGIWGGLTITQRRRIRYFRERGL